MGLWKQPSHSSSIAALCLLGLGLILFFAAAGPAAAAADDDIPGTSLALGTTVSQTVNSGDPSDVYALNLVAGEEVHFRCDPGQVGTATGTFNLLVPGASSIATVVEYDEAIYTLQAGSPNRSWVDFDYVPAKAGTYYVWVHWESAALGYTLSVKRTSRSALQLAADSDDVPGTPGGAALFTGVVSTLADPNDVYSVELTEGRTVTLRLIPITPYNNSVSVFAFLNLLDPETPSIADYVGHALAGLAQAENDKSLGNRKVGEIQYTPTISGTYFIWINASAVPYGHNFAYQLSIRGSADDTFVPPTFPDVTGSPYAAAVTDLAAMGITGGFPDGTFRPDGSVVRQQFAKMIVKTLDLTVTGAEVSPFTDVTPVPGDDPFYPVKYVAVCATAGITKGVTAAAFDPYGNITRQQLISMVARAGGLADPPGGYVPPFSASQFSLSDHYLNARRAAYAGLLDSLQGVGQSYNFSAAATRGECAQLLFNLLTH
ncbi:MAG: S-layer homology domain-containing protein [Actinobacteria bacterium]|nr:S-layer homology domain-containing protein [Actinomycetota bacterium]